MGRNRQKQVETTVFCQTILQRDSVFLIRLLSKTLKYRYGYFMNKLYSMGYNQVFLILLQNQFALDQGIFWQNLDRLFLVQRYQKDQGLYDHSA